MKPVHLTLYTAAGCHLCHEMEEVVRRAAALRRFELDIVDITGIDALERAYRSQLPVLLIGGRKAFKYRAELAELLKKLDAAVPDDGAAPGGPVSPPDAAARGAG